METELSPSSGRQPTSQIKTTARIHRRRSSSRRLLMRVSRVINWPRRNTFFIQVKLRHPMISVFQKQLLSGCYTGNSLGEAWQGPLPEPRVSPPRTLGDLIEKAIQRDIGLRGGSRSIRSPRPPSGSVPAKPEKISNSFESPEEIADPVFLLYHEVRPRSRLRRFQPRLSAPDLVWGRKQISGVMGLTIKF